MGLKYNKIIVQGDTAEYVFEDGRSTVVDRDDLEVLLGESFHINKEGYPVCRRDGKLHRLHRLILGNNGDLEIDHIDLNPLNNRRSNLRWATHSQNMANCLKRKHSKMPYKGIDKCYGGWRAILSYNKKRYRSKTFRSPEEAHEAYKEMSIKMHGEYGRGE